MRPFSCNGIENEVKVTETYSTFYLVDSKIWSSLKHFNQVSRLYQLFSTSTGVDYLVIGFDMEVQPLVTHNAA